MLQKEEEQLRKVARDDVRSIRQDRNRRSGLGRCLPGRIIAEDIEEWLEMYRLGTSQNILRPTKRH